jgi:predicted TIM-barrel fold metal-dependent hydrolase
MIIDAHTHIGADLDMQRQDLGSLQANMRKYGIDKAIVFPFNEQGNLVKASLRILQHSSKSILPFLRFDPKTMTARELQTLLDENDFYGVKLHTRSQDFNPLSRRYFPLYEVIEDHGIPLLFHTRKEKNRNSDPDRVVMLAKHFSNLNIIIGHFAAASHVAFDEIQKRKNLFVETSIFSSNYLINHVSRKIGSNKVLFGSDAPYSDQEIELLKVMKSGLGKKDMDRILWKNAARLLNV